MYVRTSPQLFPRALWGKVSCRTLCCTDASYGSVTFVGGGKKDSVRVGKPVPSLTATQSYGNRRELFRRLLFRRVQSRTLGCASPASSNCLQLGKHVPSLTARLSWATRRELFRRLQSRTQCSFLRTTRSTFVATGSKEAVRLGTPVPSLTALKSCANRREFFHSTSMAQLHHGKRILQMKNIRKTEVGAMRSCKKHCRGRLHRRRQ